MRPLLLASLLLVCAHYTAAAPQQAWALLSIYDKGCIGKPSWYNAIILNTCVQSTLPATPHSHSVFPSFPAPGSIRAWLLSVISLTRLFLSLSRKRLAEAHVQLHAHHQHDVQSDQLRRQSLASLHRSGLHEGRELVIILRRV